MKTIIFFVILYASVANAKLTPAEKDSLRDAYVLRPMYTRILSAIDSEIARITPAPEEKSPFRTLKYLKGEDQTGGHKCVGRLFNIRNRVALDEGRNQKVIWRLSAKEKE